MNKELRFKIITTIMISISYILFSLSLGFNIILGIVMVLLLDEIWNERGL